MGDELFKPMMIMKNSFIQFLLIAFLTSGLAFALGLYFPWWSIAVAGFVVGVFLRAKPGIAFLGGLVGLFLLWGGLSYFISSANHQILAHRISLLMLKQDNPLNLILITGTIGGLIGGFSTLTGSILRSIFFKPR